MKRFLLIITSVALLCGCSNGNRQLKKRALELCQYIPDHVLLEQSRAYITADFYALLDTVFNRLPDSESLDNEWVYYFVTGNGDSEVEYKVKKVTQMDSTHAVAIIETKQLWDKVSADNIFQIDYHQMNMEKVDGAWLIADFDDHKADCREAIARSREELTAEEVISTYLKKEIGKLYAQGEYCVPVLLIVAKEDDGDQARVWGDFHVYWYSTIGDTLVCTSGGNHPGCITLKQGDAQPKVIAFEPTTDGAGFEASAKRIFGKHYDAFSSIHSNVDVREAARKKQLKEYVQRHGIAAHYYQDYGWDAVAL